MNVRLQTVIGVLVGGSVTSLAIVGFHWLVRYSLAPRRVLEQRTPADLGLPHRPVQIPTANGRSLFAWFVPAATDRAPAMALLHGWGGNADTLLPLAGPLHKAGFGVLLFDARCHGRSDADTFMSMPRFAEDLEHALAWLREQPSVVPHGVGVIAHSVGAGAALLVASRSHDVAALVSIAAFAHPAQMMRRLLASKHIPYMPFGWYILRYVQHAVGYRFDDIAPIATIGRVRCPTLLVHGTEDATVPVTEAYAIYGARSGDHVQLKIIAGSHDDYGNLERQVDTLVTFLRGAVSALGPAAPFTDG